MAKVIRIRPGFCSETIRTVTTATAARLPKLPLQFLRDSDVRNFDPETHQRLDIHYDEGNGKPSLDHSLQRQRYKVTNSRKNGDKYIVDWADGVSSEFSTPWVDESIRNWRQPQVTRELWTGLTESDVRNSTDLSLRFGDLLHDPGPSKALKALYTHGILLVTDTPTEDGGAAIAAIAAAVSGSSTKVLPSSSILGNYRQGGREIVLPNGTDGPQRTLYGSVWFTDSSAQAEGTSVADSAYGVGGLPLHTDMTYMLTPPGLQIFTMVEPSAEGGESVYADGFAAAETLRLEDRHAFDLLSSTVRSYHSVDERTGWNLQASGPVIETSRGVVTRIRHNDLDRLPDLPPENTSEDAFEPFYNDLADAHRVWDHILGRDNTRLVMKLRKGDTVMVANQRCMHGRYSFNLGSTGARKVAGCYVNQDELSSRFRMEGFNVIL